MRALMQPIKIRHSLSAFEKDCLSHRHCHGHDIDIFQVTRGFSLTLALSQNGRGKSFRTSKCVLNEIEQLEINCLTEIAFLLGYSELSAFNRAFKRWTGTTFLQYRRGAEGSRI